MHKAILIAGMLWSMFPAVQAQVKTWQAPEADLERYRTYAWDSCTLLHNDLMMKPGFEPAAVREAVDRELKAKGRLPVLAFADSEIECLMGTRLDGRPEAARFGSLRPEGAPASAVTGHLLLAIRDARTGEVVWMGRFSTRLSATTSDYELMREGVRKMFQAFPPAAPPQLDLTPLPFGAPAEK